MNELRRVLLACVIRRKDFARVGEAVSVFIHLLSEGFDECACHEITRCVRALFVVRKKRLRQSGESSKVVAAAVNDVFVEQQMDMWIVGVEVDSGCPSSVCDA